MTLVEMVERAGRSRELRRERYAWYRLWWQWGSDKRGLPARYIKIKAHIDLLSSYLYAPESTQFSATVPPSKLQDYKDHLDIVRDVFTDEWTQSGADVLFSEAVEWACVLGCAGLKLVPEAEAGVSLHYIFPGDLGVLREDVRQLSRQTCIVHWYYLSLGEVERLVRGLPEADEIMGVAQQRAVMEYAAGTASYPKFMQQVIVTNIDANAVQGVVPLGALGDEVPEVQEPVVELAEVWRLAQYGKGDDRMYDYEVTTLLDRFELMTRRNPVLPAMPEFGMPGEDPFILISPQTKPDYVWGQSSIVDLMGLQELREERMANIDELLRRQLKPTAMLTGWPNAGEAMKTFHSVGGYLASPNPASKAEALYPKFPDDMWQYISRIDDDFADISGIPSVLGAANQEGIRSGQQLGALAGIATGGKLRKRALRIEDGLQTAATKFLHLLMRRDSTPYALPSGKSFLLSQLPPGIKMLVSAHSASPVFAEQLLGKADRLLQAGAIDLPTYVELVNPPRMEALREKAVGLAEGKAKMAERVLRVQEEKYLRGRARNPS